MQLVHGKTAYEVLEELEKIGTARNPKIEILKYHIDNRDLKNIFYNTYNWQLTYGISVPVPTKHVDHNEWDFDTCISVFNQLAWRWKTGDAARKVAQDMLESQSKLAQKWLTRIMNRDLQIRISTGTLDKIWPGLIPKFDIQLADTYEEGQELNFPVIAEPKLDGLRVLIFCKDGKGVALSRGAKSYESLQHIADALAKVADGVVFDGEVYAKSGWNETVSLVKTHPDNMTEDQKQRLKSNLVYHVFDLIPAPEGSLKVSADNLMKRLKAVSSLLDIVAHPNIVQVKGEWVKDQNELMEAYDKFLQQGWEGMMIKAPGAGYALGRGKNWLKFKPEVEMDVEIVSLHEGQSPNTIGKLGQIKVRTKEGVEFYVGSGFTFEDRVQFWNARETLVGKIVEIKTQKDAGQNVSKARFPIYKRLRDDRQRYEFSGQVETTGKNIYGCADYEEGELKK